MTASAMERPGETEGIAFLLVPRFSMMALFSAVEPLRVANRLSGRDLYSWKIFSVDGAPVAASNGISLVAEAAIADVPRFPVVAVCASFAPENYATKPLLAWLRKLDRQGSELGGIETGTIILAKAGLLRGYRATMHWENLPGFQEAYPDIEVSGELFERDGKRFTCSGGTGAIDMILTRIADSHGRALATAVSDSLLHARIRDPHDHQRMAVGQRLRILHPALVRIVAAMEANLEDTLTLDALASIGGVSRRQLERLFQKYLGDTPSHYYLSLRLARGRHLLEHTAMPVLDVALASGFGSMAYFSRAYRSHFGRSPRADRQVLQQPEPRTTWVPGADGSALPH